MMGYQTFFFCANPEESAFFQTTQQIVAIVDIQGVPTSWGHLEIN